MSDSINFEVSTTGHMSKRRGAPLTLARLRRTVNKLRTMTSDDPGGYARFLEWIKRSQQEDENNDLMALGRS